jgi:hypothetical protein
MWIRLGLFDIGTRAGVPRTWHSGYIYSDLSVPAGRRSSCIGRLILNKVSG